MADWVWEGRTRTGEVRKGVMDAETEEEVQQRLRQQNILPDKIQKKRASISISLPGLGGSVKSQELVIFVRQFATMIDAGLPLVQCLDILASQEANKYFQKILFEIKQSVEGGSTFADALRKYPKVFDTLFVNLIAAGEIGGILDTILNRLASYIERNVKIVRQVKGAMTYPIAILVICVAITTGLLKWVVPTFASMFNDMGGEMPALTAYVIKLSEWFQANFIYVFGIIAFIVIVFVRTIRTEKGRRAFDKIMIKSPLIGTVLRKTAVAKFTRTFGTMISSGVPILDSLDIVAKAAGNYVIQDAILYARTKVSEGSNLAPPLEETGVFPGMVMQMIAVGESTGAMDVMLQKIADFYEEESEVAIAGMTKMMEPLMMVVVGGIAGTVVISMYLPIFTMAGSAEGGG